MATWTLQQIDQVEGMYVRFVLDRIGELEKATQKASRKFIVDAHPLGVMVDSRDLVYDVGPGPNGTQLVTGRWRPMTAHVELLGGSRDGEVLAYAYAAIGRRLELPIADDLPWFAAERDARVRVLAPTEFYDLVGWREGSRRWLYRRV